MHQLKSIVFCCTFFSTLALAGALAQAKAPSLQKSVERIARMLKPALRDIKAQKESIIREWIKLSEIPAPSRKEQKRGRYIAAQMKAAGLQVRTDGIGNVVGLWRGTHGKRKKKIVLCAHMDTVFGAKENHKVRRRGSRLYGLSVLDNTVGLINMLVVARMLSKYRIKLKHDVWFVATVQEEIGLVGARYFVKQNKNKIAMMISLDGGYGGISYGGLGIHWYRMEFYGRSLHTLSSMKKPSTTLAMARAIQNIYKIRVPRKPILQKTWYNIGWVGGGKVVNAQAAKSWFTTDLRSMSKKNLEQLEQRVFAIVRKAAKETRVRVKIVTLQKMPAAQIPGMRNHLLVRSAMAVLRHQKAPRISRGPVGANDHCAGLAVGIPGINIGTTSGGKIHSPKEWAETKHLARGIQQTFLLTVLMAKSK